MKTKHIYTHIHNKIQDNTQFWVISDAKDFEQFKNAILTKFPYFDEIKADEKHLVTIECLCGKKYHIDSQEDYKDTICDCWMNILKINK